MSQVTKKIYPTVTGYTSGGTTTGYNVSNSWGVGTDKIAYPEDNFKMKLQYDLSDIGTIASGKIVLAFKGVTKYTNNNWPVAINSIVASNIGYNKTFGESNAEFTTQYTLSALDITTLKSTKKLIIEIYGTASYTLHYTIYEDMWLCDVYSKLKATEEQYIECVCVYPEIDDFSVIGTSIDSNIVCNWNAVDVTSFTVNAKLNGITKSTKNGTTETTCTFIPGDLTEPGEYTFEIIAANDSQTVVATATATLTGTRVAITSLEPNGVNQLKSSNIKLSFGGANITNYSILAKQNGVTKWSTSGKNTSGAISFNFQMVKNLFDIGNVELELTCTYNGQYYSNTVSQTATFLVYGNPSKPTIISEQTYTTPTPTINFSCADAYISYQVEVDSIRGTETFGTPNKYKIPNALSNNKYHTFKVRVKNQYQLWSEWSSVTFLISYAELETPVINAYDDSNNNSIVVNVESIAQSNFHNHSIFRSEDGQIWTEIATQLDLSDSFTDLTCASDILYYYKARANDVNGGIKDSEIVSCKCKFERSVLSVPFSQKSLTLEYFGDEESINKQIANNTERTFIRVCGLKQPKSKRSNVKYKSFNLNLAFKTKDAYEAFMKFEDEEILLFRDKKGLKMYCDMSITGEQDMLYYFKIVSIELTEVYYKEGDYEEEPDTTFSYVKDEW